MSGMIGTGGEYISKAFVKLVGKDAINKYVKFRDNIAHTDRQKELIDFAAITLLSDGFGVATEIGYGVIPNIKIPKPITAKGYEIAKQEIRLLEYFPDKPRISDHIVTFNSQNYTVAPRAMEALNRSDLGSYVGKFTIDDIIKIANSSDAKPYFSYKVFKNSSKIDYGKVPSVNVFYELPDLSDKVLRITFDSGSNRIYSIGTVEIKDFNRDVIRGRYMEIGKK
jgi:hypothetical protein